MKISDEVLDYAKRNGMDSQEAIELGMKDKAKEFIKEKYTLPDFMKILLNDEIHEVSEGSSLFSLVKELGKDDLSGWAVAINERVIPKSL